MALPAGVYLIFQKTNFFQEAFGELANLLIDAGSSYDVPGGVWQNLAQGGEEKGKRMLAPVISQVKALHPQYIRIDHVFDHYDLAALDGVISDIAATGAKPFIALSYMENVESNWAVWEEKVKSLIEHVSGKKGLNISGVYYEVWNEPDLFGGFKAGKYLDLYSRTVAAANRATGVNAFKIGGPATTGLYKSWFDGLLKLKQKGVRVDFLSWHRYSDDLNSYERDIANAQSWLMGYPGTEDLELIITEFGIESETKKINDGNLAAIQTIAVAAVAEGKIGKLFSFEIKDGPGPSKYWGRWGILTHEKFGTPEEKPRYRALQFLNNMRGQKVNVAGVGSWVKAFAKEDKGVVKILVVNYDKKGKHFEAVPLKVVNLRSKNFTLVRRDFNGKIRRTREVASDLGEWSGIETFNPNTAAIFEISY